MSNGNEGHSRRQVLTTVPAAATQPNSEIAEKSFEATADNVVNTLEAAYGVNRGKRLPARHGGPGGEGRVFGVTPRTDSDQINFQ